jgi:hypothetical protein
MRRCDRMLWNPGKRVEIVHKTLGDNTRGKRFGYVIDVDTAGNKHFFDKVRPSEPGEVAFLVSRSPDGRTGAIWYSWEALRFTKPPRDLLDQLSPEERVALDLVVQGKNGSTLEALVPEPDRRKLVKTTGVALRSQLSPRHR